MTGIAVLLSVGPRIHESDAAVVRRGHSSPPQRVGEVRERGVLVGFLIFCETSDDTPNAIGRRWLIGRSFTSLHDGTVKSMRPETGNACQKTVRSLFHIRTAQISENL
ncbi:uncharacterized protein LAESUDRAFT_721822, partial [Laetiporus sulphureus 93-53]